MAKNSELWPIIAASIASGAMNQAASAQEISNSTRLSVADISQTHVCESEPIDKIIEKFTKTHLIKNGEVIGTIAEEDGISVAELIQLRKSTESHPVHLSVDWNNIQAGKTLRVPIQSSYARKQLKVHLAKEQEKQDTLLFNDLYSQ